MKGKIAPIFEFIQIAEKLKSELRHSWTSDINRQESVAEHTWMSTLLAILIIPELTVTVDQLRVMKMIIIHDLCEAINGDIPAFEVSERQTQKQTAERIAMQKLAGLLTNKKLATELLDLWEE